MYTHTHAHTHTPARKQLLHISLSHCSPQIGTQFQISRQAKAGIGEAIHNTHTHTHLSPYFPLTHSYTSKTSQGNTL